MKSLEQLAQAALERDHLKLRSLVQDLTRSKTDFSKFPRPLHHRLAPVGYQRGIDRITRPRNNQTPPAWTKEIGALKEPFFLLESATTMKCLRTLCETQSPEPMRKRLLYAPPHFLEFA